MNHRQTIHALLLLLSINLPLIGCENKPKSAIDRQSYAAGIQMAETFKKGGVKLNPRMVEQALQDVLNERPLHMKNEDIQAELLALSQRAQERRQKDAQSNLNEAKKFMDAYMAEKGVKKTNSGLLYRILQTGKGRRPKPFEFIKLHYTGKLSNGQIFDSSILRGKPSELSVNAVIPGWREALQLMPLGSKWEIVVPPALAYGATGTTLIPPNSALIFELELLGIKQP